MFTTLLEEAVGWVVVADTLPPPPPAVVAIAVVVAPSPETVEVAPPSKAVVVAPSPGTVVARKRKGDRVDVSQNDSTDKRH